MIHMDDDAGPIPTSKDQGDKGMLFQYQSNWVLQREEWGSKGPRVEEQWLNNGVLESD